MEGPHKRRNKSLQNEEAESSNVIESEEETTPDAPKKNLKYYFNRFSLVWKLTKRQT
ncbi:uncharacterized protein LOC116435213 isoform X2 [Nomia melanderi]|uniref:uncharacterized protein LOC116435213 isoform X2 n=1 Tax=Nomia melanderi TaxID=2448451 RepID=UPI003FCEA75A